jgi:hypothetical protein
MYFLAMALPVCLALLLMLDRKASVITTAHLLASANATHRWPDEFEWNQARRKKIFRATKKAKYKEPVTHLALCPEELGLSTNVLNFDKANWFLFGLGAFSIASLFHQLALLQCMTGWSILLAKATYDYIVSRPKKPPKTEEEETRKSTFKEDYEQWRHYHPSAKVRKRRKPVKKIVSCPSVASADVSNTDTASASDEDSCALVSPLTQHYYVNGRLSFAFDPTQMQSSFPPTDLCCIACSTSAGDNSCDDWFKANFDEAEELQLVGLDNMCSRHLFSDKNDFIGQLTTIDPLEISGVAGGLTATGEGTVRVRFRNDKGLLIDKNITKALYVPESSVRLISITQLARQAPIDTETKATTSKNKTELIWEGEQVTVQHPPPATVPFLAAYLGDPPTNYLEFHKTICAFVADTPQRAPFDSSLTKTVTFAEPLDLISNKQIIEDTAPDDDYERNSPQEDFRLNLARLKEKWAPFQLSPVDKGYLSQHYRLGHLSHSQMQLLVKQGKLPSRYRNCSAPACPACIFATQHRTPWRSKGKHGHIRRDTDINPGDGTSTDQMESSILGLVQQATGNLTRRRIVGVTIFVDHATDYTYPHLMEDVTLHAPLVAKEAYERLAATFGVIIKGYHSDNGRYADTGWQDACESLLQRFSYCGVGQHSQNGIAEKRIRDLSDTTRACLLHAKQRWPEGVCTNLWPFALRYVCDVRNKVRVRDNGKTAEENFASTDGLTGIRLEHFHPFGCPIYVLEAKLQSGVSKIPRWDPRSRLGVYLGHSPFHAGSVSLVLHLTTGHVSPQYHVVFDDDFSTVENLRLGTVPTNWTELNLTQTEAATDDNFQLSKEWLQESSRDDAHAAHNIEWLTTELSQPLSLPNEGAAENMADATGAVNTVNEGAVNTANEGAVNTASEGAVTTASNNATRLSISADVPIAMTPQELRNFLQMPPPINFEEAGLRRGTRTRLPSQKAKESNYAFRAISRTILRTMSHASIQLNTYSDRSRLSDGTSNALHPMAFAAQMADTETFHYGAAMKQPDKVLFMKAMIKEVSDLFNSDVFELKRRSEITSGQKPIKSIWSFKRKRAPDGTYLKHKARLCAHGGMQIAGEHFWDTYSPVVQMSTVRLLLTLSILLGMKTRSVDFTLAFTQAPIDTETYIDLPIGFDVDGNKDEYVLQLKKTLYGLKQAGLNWFETLRTHLISIGFCQSTTDPCCFFRGDLILICYVDDCLIFCHDETKIDNFVNELHSKFTLTDEGDVATYLGIDVKKRQRDGGSATEMEYSLTQPHLTKRIIEFLALSDSRIHTTPAEDKVLLHKDEEGPGRTYQWSYRSVIGMLNYLCGTRPDILFAVHQCARFCENPKLSHEKAVKRIVRYLKRTTREGIVLRPDSTRGIQCYVDADFAGSWSSADADDPTSVYSRTGYIIMYAGCPIVWVSKLQTEVALSTTEAEYIALSQAMRDLIPLLGLLEEISPILNLHVDQPDVHWKSCGCENGNYVADLYEDNRGAYELAKAPKMRPRTKHIALKYHHFRQHVTNGTIRIHSIGTKDQIADIFTKGLARDQFEFLRKQLCGW